MEPRSLKRSLRREARAQIMAMEPDRRHAEDAELARRFATLPGLESAQTVLLYAKAFAEEIDTGPMLARVLANGQFLACPTVDAEARRLRLFLIADLEADFVPSSYGIPEPAAHCREISPEAVDWVLVPGLAFDPRGYRLGRGGGYYDRLLPQLRPEVPRWSLAYDTQWVEGMPVEPHDAPLDGIVTPSRTVTPGRTD